MAVAHYTYLVLKMLGPNGIITVKGSFELSDICDKELHKMAQSFSAIAQHKESNGRLERSTASTLMNSAIEVPIDNAAKAKKLWVHIEH
jgi:hypothetical protein